MRVTVAFPAGDAADVAARHVVRELPVDLAGYLEAGLPARTMGRDDPLFFRAALACGTALADTLPT
jgi:hypothetical protein